LVPTTRAAGRRPVRPPVARGHRCVVRSARHAR
jgi:hypothetical protein